MKHRKKGVEKGKEMGEKKVILLVIQRLPTCQLETVEVALGRSWRFTRSLYSLGALWVCHRGEGGKWGNVRPVVRGRHREGKG